VVRIQLPLPVRAPGSSSLIRRGDALGHDAAARVASHVDHLHARAQNAAAGSARNPHGRSGCNNGVTLGCRSSPADQGPQRIVARGRIFSNNQALISLSLVQQYQARRGGFGDPHGRMIARCLLAACFQNNEGSGAPTLVPVSACCLLLVSATE